MSSISGTTADESYPTAELDRRFYAFTLDRLLAWTIYAAAAYAAFVLFLDDGRTLPGIAVIVGTVVLVSAVLALLVGLMGTTPGKAAVGLRVVGEASGRPIGVGPAMLRTLVLGVATLPTMGLGVATLAWTAVMDRDRKRRGWHDHLAHSVVVDVRPAPVEEAAAPERPRNIVNLTAMRLVPASPTPPRDVPSRVRRSRWAAGPTGADGAPQEAVPVAASTAVAAPASTGAASMDRTPAPAPVVIDGPAEPPPVVSPGADVGDPLSDPLSAPIVVEPSTPTTDPAEAGVLGEGGGRRMGPRPPVSPDVAVPPQPAAPPARRAEPAPAAPVVPPVAPVAAAPAAPAARAQPPAPPAPVAAPAAPVASPAPTRVPARWSVTFDTGDAFVVDGFTLVGRNPEPRPGEPVKRRVALPSSDMSLSKTHAQFQVVPDGALVVMDRGSTNGSLLLRAGVTKELGAGRPQSLRDGDVVRFGDREMRVVREA